MTYDDNPFRCALDGWTASQWIKDDWSDPYFPERQCVRRRVDTQLPLQIMVDVGAICRFRGILDRTAKAMFPDRTDSADATLVNDHPDTTFDDIVAILEKCAIRWDEPA